MVIFNFAVITKKGEIKVEERRQEEKDLIRYISKVGNFSIISYLITGAQIAGLEFH